MAEAGADAIIVHVGTTVGGSIGVREAVVSWEDTIERCQTIVRTIKETRKEVIPLAHGGPINTPEDVERIVQHTDVLGFVGASSLERMAMESSLPSLTQTFKAIHAPAAQRFGLPS